jgi:hypothetical protein
MIAVGFSDLPRTKTSRTWVILNIITMPAIRNLTRMYICDKVFAVKDIWIRIIDLLWQGNYEC